jgi:hypothetical protein
MGCVMNDEHTVTGLKRYLDELAEDSPAEPIVRAFSTGPSPDSTCSAPPDCTAAIPA